MFDSCHASQYHIQCLLHLFRFSKNLEPIPFSFTCLSSAIFSHNLQLGSCFLSSFELSCLGAPIVLVLLTYTFIMVAAYYMGVRLCSSRKVFGCQGCPHGSLDVMPGTAVPVEYGIEIELSRAVEYSHFKCKSLWRELF